MLKRAPNQPPAPDFPCRLKSTLQLTSPDILASYHMLSLITKWQMNGKESLWGASSQFWSWYKTNSQNQMFVIPRVVNDVFVSHLTTNFRVLLFDCILAVRYWIQADCRKWQEGERGFLSALPLSKLVVKYPVEKFISLLLFK